MIFPKRFFTASLPSFEVIYSTAAFSASPVILFVLQTTAPSFDSADRRLTVIPAVFLISKVYSA